MLVGGRRRLPVFLAIMLALLHRLLQFHLVISTDYMNLSRSLVADSVNSRINLLRRCDEDQRSRVPPVRRDN
jgi:hypothetical protein